MFVQVPGGVVRVEECGIELFALKAVQDLCTRLEGRNGVVLLEQRHRTGDNANSFSTQVAKAADSLCLLAYHQAKSAAGVGHTPGQLVRRAGTVRLAQNHVAPVGSQAAPRA